MTCFGAGGAPIISYSVIPPLIQHCLKLLWQHRPPRGAQFGFMIPGQIILWNQSPAFPGSSWHPLNNFGVNHTYYTCCNLCFRGQFRYSDSQCCYQLFSTPLDKYDCSCYNQHLRRQTRYSHIVCFRGRARCQLCAVSWPYISGVFWNMQRCRQCLHNRAPHNHLQCRHQCSRDGAQFYYVPC